jgi:hypothetical protein
VYGDEVATNIRNVSDGLLAAGKNYSSIYVFRSILPNSTVSRTGYNETDLTDNKASNTKMDLSLHYRPLEMKT